MILVNLKSLFVSPPPVCNKTQITANVTKYYIHPQYMNNLHEHYNISNIEITAVLQI